MSEKDRRIGRRRFLQYAGVSGASVASVAMAGCIGDDEEALEDDDDDDPPDDDDDPAVDDDDDDPAVDDDDDDPPDDEPFEITMTQRQDPTTLDPHNHRETPTDNVILHAYEGVLWRNREGEIIESLATEWEVVEDDRHRFTVRDGVQFHDGTEMQPSDLAFSINRVVQPDVGGLESPQRDQLEGIVDAEVSDGDLVVHSEGANPMALANLASHCPVMSEEWVGTNEPEEIAVGMNGTGPFQLEDYQEGEFTLLSSFEDYWGEVPEVDQVEIIAAAEDSTRVGQLEAGETDVISAVPPPDASRVEGDDDLWIADMGSTRILLIAMRYDIEPFDSREFRQAMNYAIDLDEMIDEILRGFGQATSQPTLPGYFGYNPDLDPYPYDPDRAEELVDESGYAGAEIEIHYPAGRYLLNDELSRAAAGFIDDLENVSAEAVTRDFGAMTDELLDGDITTQPAIYNIGWGNTTFDASQTIIPFLTEGTAIYHYVNPEMEDLIAESNVETDPDRREELLQEANRVAHEDAAWIFLNQEWLLYGVNERIDWDPRQDELFLAQDMRPS